ncbi:MAG TPA: dTDP-4-dehydrorhamnose 3,5-epimerase [Sedimenticola sp.]|nr:dTDP-4-dehydrorhamnose 3,5-epimerase [Sedimenticola sp.]
MIKGVMLTPLSIVPVPEGDVLHAIRADSPGFRDFGEAYFSTVGHGRVKAWKRHRRMTLNIVVPVGEILFAIHDDREGSVSRGQTQSVILSRDNYRRLTVAPGLWMGFQGLEEGLNLLLNVADLMHDPAEADRLAPEAIAFDWETT